MGEVGELPNQTTLLWARPHIRFLLVVIKNKFSTIGIPIGDLERIQKYISSIRKWRRTPHGKVHYKSTTYLLLLHPHISIQKRHPKRSPPGIPIGDLLQTEKVHFQMAKLKNNTSLKMAKIIHFSKWLN